jgi:capsule polysaccharide export protein KpsE/RkpR
MENNVKFGVEKMWRWKWWILASCTAAVVISIFMVQQMQDEYKSTAAFVPPSFTSLGTMVFGNGVAYRGFYAADEEDIDRTVAYLESKEVMDELAKKFDLYAHYGIDPNSDNAQRRFFDHFRGMVKISFASNSVVEVECWDTDKKVAQDLANAYLEVAGQYFERVSQRHEGLAASEKQLLEVETERQVILDSLATLREKYKVYHIDHAGEEITKILAVQMRTEPMFHKYYDAVKSMETYISTLELRFGDLKREVMARQLNMEQYPRLMWVTERPSLSEFKDRPKRSILVILSFLGTFVMASFLAVVLDRSRPQAAA